MKLQIPCRHCGSDRLWQNGSGGALVAAVSVPGVDSAAVTYVCLASPSGVCEPRPARSSGQRMIDDLAARSRARWSGVPMRGKRR